MFGLGLSNLMEEFLLAPWGLAGSVPFGEEIESVSAG
jgi:hypothetical protein